MRGSFPVELSVQGPEWGPLVASSQKVMAGLRQSGLVVELDTNYQFGMPELRITPDRARVADLGISIETVATTINALVGGVRAGKYSAGGRRVDVRLKLLHSQRTRPEDLAKLRVRTAHGELVPLSSLVSYEMVPALQSITRRDRERAISIYANVAPGHSQDDALSAVEMIGILLLMGIVKKNSLILVDYANQVRRTDGLDAAQAMLRAGPVRLRPILMTTMSTLAAAIPSALALGPESEVRAPMAMAVIGGLVVSTTLSLLVVPAFYVVTDRAMLRLRRWFGDSAAAQTPVDKAA